MFLSPFLNRIQVLYFLLPYTDLICCNIQQIAWSKFSAFQSFNIFYIWAQIYLEKVACFWKSFQTQRTIVLPIHLYFVSTYEERPPGNQDPRMSNKELWQASQQWLFFISNFRMTFLAIYYSSECVLVWWLIYLVSTDWIARDYLCRSCLENISCLEV